jgi:hypothetical protein
MLQAAAATMLITLALGAPAREVVEPEIVPDLEAMEGMPLEIQGNVVTFPAGPGVQGRVRPLSELERGTFFRMRARVPGDPFPPREVYPEGFTVFEVSFLNASRKEFQFSPGMASISAKKGRLQDWDPFDIGALYSYFSRVFQSDETAVERALDAVYTRTTILEPGKRMTRLLVFEGLPKRARRFKLHLDFMHLGSSSVDVAIPYRVVREKRRR